jgi:hypothetical protein
MHGILTKSVARFVRNIFLCNIVLGELGFGFRWLRIHATEGHMLKGSEISDT